MPSHHGLLDLALELLLHSLLGEVLLCRVEYAHCFEIQGANASHEDLLQIFLHDVPVSVLNLLLSLGLVKPLAQSLDFFLVSGAYRLKLHFDSVVKLCLVSLLLGLLEAAHPSLEDSPLCLDPVLRGLVAKHCLAMLLEVSVPLKGLEAPHLQKSHPGHRLALTRPQCHNFASQ